MIAGSGGALAGRTALVTGASRGIGAEIARALAAGGARVALVARTQSALEALAGEIGGDALVVAGDLSQEASLSKAATAVRDAFGGPPDILVNNAGVFRIVALESMEPADFSAMLRLNLLAPFLVSREFLPAMRARGSGHVITIGSIADRVIYAGNGAYSASKFGMRAIHEVLREETRGSGIKATLVSPASVDTDIWDPIRFPGESASPDRSGMMDPAAVADAVLYAVTRPSGVNIDELRLSRA
ncbi:MAG TPA: SDR family oxidoreductase [Gemmatimonadaceae bacterium]|nr:SDR family oxidoreductase [Gemmatimonadaceae bacterium]